MLSKKDKIILKLRKDSGLSRSPLCNYILEDLATRILDKEITYTDALNEIDDFFNEEWHTSNKKRSAK